ncbi:facilitated trehalose transporter Tret1-like [Macrosteles quadrilineatus]|uniref:facilitated trehalose transporter Tret1-like n=1 Tax=Macrosteles quadrilineatus TaxID=74068 RepID=UPI0023E0B0B8|nr:facilitated trehalose transporter Tret1-like [Macrosteles quadrilineatus]
MASALEMVTLERNNDQQQIASRLPQFLAALIANLGGFIVGSSRGWTSTSQYPLVHEQEYGFSITTYEFAWIGSAVAIGNFFAAPCLGYIMSKFGRKRMMMAMCFPAALGYTLVAVAHSVKTMYIGRIMTGMCVGGYFIIVPLYTAEIAETQIRGTLGTFLQVMNASGILFTYIVGSLRWQETVRGVAATARDGQWCCSDDKRRSGVLPQLREMVSGVVAMTRDDQGCCRNCERCDGKRRSGVLPQLRVTIWGVAETFALCSSVHEELSGAKANSLHRGVPDVPVVSLTEICLAIVVVYFFLLICIPESPIYYLLQNNEEDARKSLQWLRGSHYNIDVELAVKKQNIDEMKAAKLKFIEAFSTKAAKKGLVICLGLVLIRQFSGMPGIIYYNTKIFHEAGFSLSPNIQTILLGSLNLVFTMVSSTVIDKLGRRPLLFISGAGMATSTFFLGLFFFLKDRNYDLSSIAWLPLVIICIFVISFSLGFGPVPTVLFGETFPRNIATHALSVVFCLSSFSLFIVTFYFEVISLAIGRGGINKDLTTNGFSESGITFGDPFQAKP